MRVQQRDGSVCLSQEDIAQNSTAFVCELRNHINLKTIQIVKFTQGVLASVVDHRGRQQPNKPIVTSVTVDDRRL